MFDLIGNASKEQSTNTPEIKDQKAFTKETILLDWPSFIIKANVLKSKENKTTFQKCHKLVFNKNSKHNNLIKL